VITPEAGRTPEAELATQTRVIDIGLMKTGFSGTIKHHMR